MALHNYQWSIDRTAQPSIEPVPGANAAAKLQTVKDFCEYDRADKDALFQDVWIPAAREEIERRIGRSLIERERILYLDGFHGAKRILLPCPPLAPAGSPPSITYIDAAGVEQTWSTSLWSAVDCGPNALSYVEPKYGETWPSVRVQPQSVTITFLSGYQDDPYDPDNVTGNMVPASIRDALLNIVRRSLGEHNGQAFSIEEILRAKLPPPVGLAYEPWVWE